MTRGARRALGLVVGYGLDAALADPHRHHPVAWFGRAASLLEREGYAPSRPAGAVDWALLVVPAVGLGIWCERRAPLLATAAATYVVLGGTSLAREGSAMATRLHAGDLPGGRRRLSHLCSRDAAALDADQLARATCESLAENTSDAVVAPLLWGAVAGVPGLLGYRAVNTLDAMWGYRDERYREFGWCAARADDLANLVPARACAALTVALAPLVGGSPSAAWRAWRDDAPAHPSPNAGPVEATAAGALGIRLGGSSAYGGHVEDRGVLGDGREVQVGDIARAVRLSRLLGAAALGLAVVVALAGDQRRG